VGEEDLDHIAAQHPLAMLLVAGDWWRLAESDDLAVIVPELDKALGHNVAVLVASREAERAMQRRFHFASFPALVFLREGAYLGAMEGIRDWQDYVAELPEMLTRQPASPPPFRMPQGCATRRRRLMSGSPSIPGLEDLLGALAGPQVGPGSQPDGPDEARLDYMIMPEEMRVFSMAAIPDSASGHAAGLAAGEAILAALERVAAGGRGAWTFARWGRMIWPLSTSCWARARFRWCWAQYQAQEAVLAGVWRVRQNAPDGTRLADRVDIGAFPAGFIAAALAHARGETVLPEKRSRACSTHLR
jgi:hydrogenase-1 operon protein HyaE